MAEHTLRAVAFPRLDDSQIAQLARCTDATVQRYDAGQTLFAVGERDFKFFVIKSGEVEIVDPAGDTPKTITVHGPGEFTGQPLRVRSPFSSRRAGRACSPRATCARVRSSVSPRPSAKARWPSTSCTNA
jgi:CRP-like cAMP-binding protein